MANTRNGYDFESVRKDILNIIEVAAPPAQNINELTAQINKNKELQTQFEIAKRCEIDPEKLAVVNDALLYANHLISRRTDRLAEMIKGPHHELSLAGTGKELIKKLPSFMYSQLPGFLVENRTLRDLRLSIIKKLTSISMNETQLSRTLAAEYGELISKTPDVMEGDACLLPPPVRLKC